MKTATPCALVWLAVAACGDEAPTEVPRRAVRVEDGAGQPIAGAEVHLLPHSDWLRGDPPLSQNHPDPWSAAIAEGARFVTDADGRALLSNDVGYVVARLGGRSATATVSRTGEPTLVLELSKPREIEIRVALDDGSPAGAVGVALHQGPYEEGRLGPVVWRWRTDAEGRARARFLPAASRGVALSASVVVPGVSAAATVAAEDDTVDLSLPPVGEVWVTLNGGPEPARAPKLSLARPPVGPGFPREWPTAIAADGPRRHRFWPVPLDLELRIGGDRQYFDPVVIDGPTTDAPTSEVELRARAPKPKPESESGR